MAIPSQNFNQPPAILIPSQNAPGSQIPSQSSPHPSQSPKPNTGNVTQFKVKPAAALMPDDKKDRSKVS